MWNVYKGIKMRKKNKQTWLYAGIGLVVIAFAVFFIYNAVSDNGFKFGGKTLAIGDVPAGCNSYGQGTTDNEFTCPSKQCDVNGWGECTEQTGDIPTVIYRTNSIIDTSRTQTFSRLFRYKYHPEYGTKDAWIAVDLNADNDKAGTLTAFRWTAYSSTNPSYSSCTYSKYATPVKDENGLPLISPDGYSVYYDSKYSQLLIYNGPCYRNKFDFSNDGDIDTSLVSDNKYASKNQEIMGGVTNAFSCSVPWSIKSSTGSVREKGDVTYGANDAGKYQTGIKRLSANEKFIFPGKINYAIIDTTTSCAIDLCNSDNSGVIKCLLKDGCKVKAETAQNCNAGTYCVQSDTGAGCFAPFETEFDLSEGFTTADIIQFDYTIKSTRVSSVSLTFKLVDPKNSDRVIDVAGPITTSLPQTKHITFKNPGIIGTYEVWVEKTYSGVTLEPEVKEIRIGNPLSMTMSIPYSELTATTILAGAPFYVDIEVSENGVPTTDLSSVNIKATLKDVTGKTTPVPIPTPTTKNDVYRYTFVASEPGLFSVEATADKFGVISNTEKREAEVRDAKISISYTNMGFLINTKPGILTVEFETKDAFGQYLDTSNRVKIIPSGASTGADDIDVTSNVVINDVGKYEFSYNFVTGTYIIEISSTAPGYVTTTTLRSPALNIDEGAIIKDCTTSEDCPSGKICNSEGSCVDKEPPITLYLIIIFGIIIFIVLIIVIINLIRKKSTTSSQDINIGGGL